MRPDNDNDVLVFEGSGNIFQDFELDDAILAMEALQEFYTKGGRRFEDFKAELRLETGNERNPS